MTRKKFCLNSHYNGEKGCLFVNGTEIIKFKAKYLEIKPIALYLENVSKDLSVDNLKKTGFYGYVYDFVFDYDAIAVDNILDILKYLMRKNGM